jgi:hypothetical protein
MGKGINKFSIKPHAAFEMKRRQITEDQVKYVVESPEQTLTVSHYRKIYQSVLNVEGKSFLFRVFVDTDSRPPEVVTVYRTSKIGKYWR